MSYIYVYFTLDAHTKRNHLNFALLFHATIHYAYFQHVDWFAYLFSNTHSYILFLCLPKGMLRICNRQYQIMLISNRTWCSAIISYLAPFFNTWHLLAAIKRLLFWLTHSLQASIMKNDYGFRSNLHKLSINNVPVGFLTHNTMESSEENVV